MCNVPGGAVHIQTVSYLLNVYLQFLLFCASESKFTCGDFSAAEGARQ